MRLNPAREIGTTSTASQENSHGGRVVWLYWVFTNALGGLSAVAFAAALNAFTGYWAFLVLFVVGAAAGPIWLVLGLSQSVVLGRYVPAFGRRSAIGWAALSAVAASIGVWVAFWGLAVLTMVSQVLPFASFVGAPLLGAVVGLFIGLGQVAVLGEARSMAKDWMIANLVGWPIGLLVTEISFAGHAGAGAYAPLAIVEPHNELGLILRYALLIAVASCCAGLAPARRVSVPVSAQHFNAHWFALIVAILVVLPVVAQILAAYAPLVR